MYKQIQRHTESNISDIRYQNIESDYKNKRSCQFDPKRCITNFPTLQIPKNHTGEGIGSIQTIHQENPT